MRLKYQLRGLGIGVMITAALLMGASGEEKGAVRESTTLAAETTEETVTETAAAETIPTETEPITETIEEATPIETAPAEIMTTEESSESSAAETQEETEVSTETSSEETEQESSAFAEESSSNDVIEIKIVKGDDSGTVARKLQLAGLVDNASEYDAYLMQHGYDKKITTGTVEIAKGSSWQEIAEKLAGKRK